MSFLGACACSSVAGDSIDFDPAEVSVESGGDSAVIVEGLEFRHSAAQLEPYIAIGRGFFRR